MKQIKNSGFVQLTSVFNHNVALPVHNILGMVERQEDKVTRIQIEIGKEYPEEYDVKENIEEILAYVEQVGYTHGHGLRITKVNVEREKSLEPSAWPQGGM